MRLSISFLVISTLLSQFYASFIDNEQQNFAMYEAITSGSIAELANILDTFHGDINEKPFSLEDDVITLSPLDLAIFSRNTVMINLIIELKGPIIDQSTFEMVFRSSCVECFDVIFEHSKLSQTWDLNRIIINQISKFSATNDLFFAFVTKILKHLSFNDKLALIENAFDTCTDHEQISLTIEAVIIDVTYGHQDHYLPCTKRAAVLSLARSIVFQKDFDDLFLSVDSLYQASPVTFESKALIAAYIEYIAINNKRMRKYLQPEDILSLEPAALSTRVYAFISTNGRMTGGLRVLLTLLQKHRETENFDFRNHYEAFQREKDTYMLIAIDATSSTCLKFFLDHGANPNAQAKFGFAAIRMAVNSITPECLKLLIEYGADVNVNDRCPYNLLISAVLSKSVDCLEVLLAHGADTTVSTQFDLNPLFLATKLKSPELLTVLFKHKIDQITAETRGQELLESAIFRDSGVCVQVILDNIEIPVTLEIILFSIRKNSPNALNALLAANESIINVADEHGITALVQAVRQRSSKCLKVLLDHGVDPNVLDDKGMTLLSYENLPHMEEIIPILREYGAHY